MPWPARRRPRSPCRSRTPPTRAPSREGALLGAYSFDAYKENGKSNGSGKDAKNGKAPLAEVALLGGKPRDKAYKAAVERATAVTEELNRARDLINTPPNDLNPEAFAAVAQAAGKEHGIKVQVLDEKALEKGGYGGILGVGAGLRVRAPPGEAVVHLLQGEEAPRLRRQGHHLRLGRHLAEAGRATTRR